MKPTEQDIQAELDRHGLGWEIVEWFAPNESDGLRFVRLGKSNLEAVFYTKISFDNMNVKHFDCHDDLDIEIQYTDFLTGNYDLSAISQHYEPEEWQRIISMCERIVRLITGEQTLEEAVNDEIAAIVETDKGIESFELDKSGVLLLTKNNAGLNGQKHEFAITPRSVNYRISSGPWKYNTLLDYLCEHPSEEWTHTVLQLAREVQRQTQSPSYSDLEQRVEELEKEAGRLNEDLDTAVATISRMGKQVEGWQDECGNKSDRITDLEAQLQDYISPADHEREISEWETAFEAERKNRMDQTRLATKYREWFEEAHTDRLSLRQEIHRIQVEGRAVRTVAEASQ